MDKKLVVLSLLIILIKNCHSYTANGTLRLFGSGTYDGILEIYYSGRWGSVCDDGWNAVASRVACRQLGFNVYRSYNFRQSITNDFWLDDVRCNGNETVLVDCSNNGWGINDCTSREGIYLHCSNYDYGTLRLHGNGSDNGILEIYYKDRWGSVCDDGWNALTSRVACRQLGFSSYISYTHGNSITNDFWLDEMTCHGNELLLIFCYSDGWGKDDCGSREGIYLHCGRGRKGRSSPFSQFLAPSNTNCSTDEFNSCADIVFIVDIGSAISTDYTGLIELTDHISEGTQDCTHRYGLTVFGLSDVITTVFLNGISYFGTISELNRALMTHLSQASDTITNEHISAFEGVNRVLEYYPFREGVERKIVLVANEPRNVTNSSIQYTYENTLLNLLQNRITLSVLTTGVQYFSNTDDRLIGINFNNRNGFGQFYSTTCPIANSNSFYLTTDTHYIVQSGYEWNYRSYVQLAWNTNGSSYDLSYLNSETTSYCSVRAARIFSYGTFRAAVCNPQGNTYSPSSETSTNFYRTQWGNIATIKTRCVDMVFLLDRTPSMKSYFDSIKSLLSLLPDNGDNCTNRYGLTLFDDTAEKRMLGSSYWGTSSELSSALLFVDTGTAEDGFLGIDYILKHYTFRKDVGKHIVLFTDESRSIVDSTLTISSISSLLEQNNIVFSVVSDAEDFYYKRSYYFSYSLRALVLYSDIIIGFNSFDTPIRVYANSPGYYRLHNSNQHKNYVELAWSTSGVAYNLDFFKSSFHYARNSVLFNTLMFSYQELGEYYLISIGTSVAGAINSVLQYTFHCETNTIPNTSISIILNDTRYTNSGNYISITAGLWDATLGEYNFICLASNGTIGNVWLGTYRHYEKTTTYPFQQFAPGFNNTGGDNTFSYGSMSTLGNYTTWIDINPQAFSDCVDMVFVVDKTYSIADYLPGIKNIVANLPTNGISCTNRYGLTLFSSSASAFYVGGGSNLFGTPNELFSEFLYSQSYYYNNPDGLRAIAYTISKYNSSFRSEVPKHIVLMTDEDRYARSSITKMSVLKSLNETRIVLSVITSADHFRYYNSTYVYLMASIKMSGTMIGFANDNDVSDEIDAISPISLNTLDSNAHTNYVELAWETGGIAFDIFFCENSKYYHRLSATFNKLMFSWGIIPYDFLPIITYPASNTTFSPTLSYTYTQIIVCTATGYPQPTVLWYNSDNEAITTGATLQLDASNVSDGRVYICKADNGLGFDSRSIEFSISDTQVDTEGILDEINEDIRTTSEFGPNQVGNIAEIVANILPNTSNVPIRDVNNIRDLLGKCANTIEDLFDKITDNDTAITPGDAGKIANTAGDIINKDNELDRTIDNLALSPETINQGGIASASGAIITALRTIEKVCHNLGQNNLKNEQLRESFVVKSVYVGIHGETIPVANLLNEETFPINLNAENIQDRIDISRNTAVNLAGNQTNLKVVIAIVGKYSGIYASRRQGTGLKQDSNIIIIVIPGRTGSVPLVDYATITLSTASNYSSNKVGSYLNENFWSTNGTTTEFTSHKSIELNVNHFTSFVIFANYPSSSEFYLTIASYTLSCISVLCLVISLFLFILSSWKGFFKIEINILYFNLCIALLISSLLFILYGLNPNMIGLSDIFCKIMAGVIHYSWILVFTWCFAFSIYITYKISFGINKNRKIYPYIILFAWTIPVIFPIIAIAIKSEVYVDESKHCFPSKQEYTLLSLLVPVIVLSLITIGILVAISIRFKYVRERFDDDAIRVGIKHIILSTAILTCILTVPWIVLMVYFFVDNTLIEWAFVLLNDTMGIYFFIFIALRVREVRCLILCKSTKNVQENVAIDIRPRATNNPIFDGNIVTGDGQGGYENLLEESGAIVHHEPTASHSSTQISYSDLPPAYDLFADSHPSLIFSNIINESAAVEHAGSEIHLVNI